jgi:hypothetical protein
MAGMTFDRVGLGYDTAWHGGGAKKKFPAFAGMTIDGHSL